MADGLVAERRSRPLGNSAWALAVLSRSRLALEVTGPLKLGQIARMGAPAKGLAWPLAARDTRTWGKVPRGQPEANHWPEETSRTWWATDAIPPPNSLTSHANRLAEQKEGWKLLLDSWLWDAQNHQVTLLWHSQCFQDQDSLRRSLGGQNVMGLQEWKPLPKFWHGLRPRKSECDGCGLQEGILKQTRGWMQLQRPLGQLMPFHRKGHSRKDELLQLREG